VEEIEDGTTRRRRTLEARRSEGAEARPRRGRGRDGRQGAARQKGRKRIRTHWGGGAVGDFLQSDGGRFSAK
jgi:hypothetical protein